jgi:hypothetical protein
VTTPDGELPEWSWKEEPPAWVPEELAALLVPAPSAGSCPFAIWTASPPKIAPAAAKDAAIIRMLSVRVESLGLRSVLGAEVMRRSLAVLLQHSLRAALALYKNHSPIRKRCARAEPP